MASRNATHRVDRSARLMYVPLDSMKVSPGLAQRAKLDKVHVDKIARGFDPDKFDAPKINRRDGIDWIVDGWHRCEGAKLYLGAGQAVQCWVRLDLTNAEAAEWSIGLNDFRAWNSMDRWGTALVAGRETECDVDRIVRSHGLTVGRSGIRAVNTLLRVYGRGGPPVLSRMLLIIRDAYGDAGFEASVIDGIGLLCQRYPALDTADAIAKLSKAHGGVNGLLGKAGQLHRLTGNGKAHCVAAAAVEIINGGRRSGRLESWWK